MVWEEAVARNMDFSNREKTFSDKVFARDEVEKIKDLMRKDSLSRQDLNELLYLMSSTESKLLNLGEWDRYVMAKYYVWVREFFKQLEILFDYIEDIEKKEKNGEITLKPTTRKLLYNNRKLAEHNLKFLIDFYFQIMRTSLSLGGQLVSDLLGQKFEFQYKTPQSLEQQVNK